MPTKEHTTKTNVQHVPPRDEPPMTAGAGILDDELPQAPTHSIPDTEIPFGQEAQFSGEIPADVWDSVPDKDEALKMGTYHFRLKGFKKGFTAEQAFPEGNPNKPNYKLAWVCQEEPYTGRFIYDNSITWASAQDIADANNASSPHCAEARKTVKDRLFRARKMLAGMGVDLKAFGNNLDTFLASEPECKIKIKPTERMVDSGKRKPDGGKLYVGTGEMTNNDIISYHPLAAPSR